MTDTRLTVTLVGGPTALLEYAGLRWLTDPTFDPPGHYERENAPALDKTTGPALSADDVGDVDVALVSHDHHADNLDGAGRAWLPHAGRRLTTTAGAERLGAGAAGLEPWDTVELPRPGGGSVTVTAVPAQHGPDGTDHLTGPVIGFVLATDGLPSVYVSGDNASVDVVHRIVDRLGPLELAVLFAGGACLPGRFDGALLTLGGPQAAQAARVLGARAVVPVHQEGWTHFSHGPSSVREAFAAAGLGDVLHEAAPGQTVTV
jgi:L-ascorbate metabolism protein UlaG (beta-lactamase superfamily)